MDNLVDQVYQVKERFGPQRKNGQVGLKVFHFFWKNLSKSVLPSQKSFVQVKPLQKFGHLQIVNVAKVDIFGSEFPTIFLHFLN